MTSLDHHVVYWAVPWLCFLELGWGGGGQGRESGGKSGGCYMCQNALFCCVVFCQRLVWLMNISSSPQRTCPSEERPQTCYCSDYMSIKHPLNASERESERGRSGRCTWAKGWDGSKAREEQPERKVITDNYGQERRKEDKSLQMYRFTR